MTSLPYYLSEVPSSELTLVWGVVISSFLHLLLILVLIGVPGLLSPKRTYFSSTYMVKLVDVPRGTQGKTRVAAGERSKEEKLAVGETAKEKLEKVEETKKVEEKKSTGLTVKDKVEKSSAVKTVQKKVEVRVKDKEKDKNKEKEFSSALDKIKERVDERQRKEKLESLREKIAEGERAGTGVGVGEGGALVVGSSGLPFGQGMIANLPLNYQLYYSAIEQKIKSNWNLALPRGVVEDMKGMEVVLSVKIKADGEIVDISYEQKSGNIYLDESAFRAIKKSNPLPPFDEYNIREPFFETGIIFPAVELL